MARIQRFNVILDVDDSQVDYYINLGYNLIDNRGNVIKKSMSNDVRTLQRELQDSQNKISELEAEIKRLNAVIEELKTSEVKSASKTTKKKAAE